MLMLMLVLVLVLCRWSGCCDGSGCAMFGGAAVLRLGCIGAVAAFSGCCGWHMWH